MPKGHYTVRLQVKHDDVTLLESYDSTPMVLERKLSSSVNVPCFASQSDALLNTAVATIPLFVGTSCSVIFGEPDISNLPNAVQAGDFFHGKATYLKKPGNMMGSGTRPGGYTISYFYTGAKVAKPPASTGASVELKPSEEKKAPCSEANLKDKVSAFEMDDSLRNAIRDTKMKYLAEFVRKPVTKEVLLKCLDDHPFNLAYESMLAEYPNHIPLRLHGLDYALKCATSCSESTFVDVSEPEEKYEKCGDGDCGKLITRFEYYKSVVVRSADDIFDMIDKVAIMTELGVLVDSNDSTESKRRKDIEIVKDQVRMMYEYCLPSQPHVLP